MLRSTLATFMLVLTSLVGCPTNSPTATGGPDSGSSVPSAAEGQTSTDTGAADPAPGTATTDDTPTGTSTATTATEPPFPSPDDLAFIEALTAAALTANTTASTAVTELIDDLFAINQGQPVFTLTGTATFDASNKLVSYTSAPTDRLTVTTPEGTVEYFVSAFEGSKSSASSFKANHSDLRFRYVAAGVADFNCTDSSSNDDTTLHAVGTVQLSRGPATVDVTRTSSQSVSSFDDFFSFRSEGGIEGTIQSAGGSIVVHEIFDIWSQTAIGLDQHLYTRKTTSTGSQAGHAYALSDVLFEQVISYYKVANEWTAEGTLIRDGATVGTCLYDSTPVKGAAPPDRILKLNNETIFPM